MNPELAIEVENVSKKFCRNIRRSMLYGLKDIARNSVGLSSHSESLRDGEFWAVQDVSLKVEKGESMGLIGPNGSGKTTLLKMINGIYWPDRGRVSVRGKVGALIEVGAGFHPMLTGRENIFVNAAILGMTREETNERLDDIIRFADIGDFIDSPVKFYSSGMYVRLGFSVAVHCTPDVLLVDEVLAVGDRAFAMKCYQKIHEIRKRGATIILVSHNIYVIKEQTDRCIYLSQGQERYLGSTEDAITMYLDDTASRPVLTHSTNPFLKSSVGKKAEVLTVEFFDRSGHKIDGIESGSNLSIVVRFEAKSSLSRPVVSANFYGEGGFMYCANSYYEGKSFGEMIIPGVYDVRISIPGFHIPHGSYICAATLAEEGPDNPIEWHDLEQPFVVSRARDSRGSVKLPTEWGLRRVDSRN